MEKKFFKQIGTTQNGWNFPVISNGDEFYVVNEQSFNGEHYLDCWRCEDKFGNYDPAFDDKSYKIAPIYQGIGEPDDDGDYESYEVIDYEII